MLVVGILTWVNLGQSEVTLTIGVSACVWLDRHVLVCVLCSGIYNFSFALFNTFLSFYLRAV